MDLLSPSFVMQSHSDSAVSDHCYCQVQNKQGEGHLVFSRFLQTPPHLLIYFSNFTREANKVFKDNPNFISSLSYFVPVF